MQKKRVLKKRITEESNAEISIRLSQLERALELEHLRSKAYNKNDIKNNTKTVKKIQEGQGQGKYPDLSGTSGEWSFDVRSKNTVLNTIYANWYYDYHYSIIDYLSAEGDHRTASNLQIWNRQTNKFEQFDAQNDYTYGPLKDRYAVVVATSVTWPNYRHQADAMAMYQLLKRHGYDDDHIILILENNLADNPNNLYPGVVKVYPHGENLNVDVKVDYKISDLKISDLSDILTGRKSDRLPIVLNSGASDNVIVFWCGHGNRGLLEWGEQSYIRGWQVADILKQMKSEGRFRKMMFVTEACYSGSIAEACEGTQGVLFLTAARADEISLADIPDEEMGIYLSDGFTRVFQETIESDPTISIHGLYLKLARGTIGSHAMIYNYKNYGNIYTNNLREYL